VFPLTARAGLVGALVQWENPAVCAVRDGDARVRGGAVGARVPADGARGACGRAGAVGEPRGVRRARRRGDPEARQAGSIPGAHQLRVRPNRAGAAVAMIESL